VSVHFSIAFSSLCLQSHFLVFIVHQSKNQSYISFSESVHAHEIHKNKNLLATSRPEQSIDIKGSSHTL